MTNPKAPERPLRVGMISLGCAKNLVDAEIMVGRLLADGMQVTSDTAQADVLIINTCSFIDAAQEESVDTILESAQVREAQNRGQGLVVAGCLPQRFRDQLPQLLPEAEAFIGVDQITGIGEIVRQAWARRRRRLAAGAESPQSPVPSPQSTARGSYPDVQSSKFKVQGSKLKVRGSDSLPSSILHPRPAGLRAPSSSTAPSAAPAVAVSPRPHYIPDASTPRYRLTPRHFAYLKIAEGCNHPCSFCIIPRMRGSHRSRQPADLVAEARALLADGARELNLISQDSTYYGMDLRPNHSRAVAAPEKFSAALQARPPDAPSLCTLLRELNALPGDFWVRLLYTHPAHWTDELIQTIAECPKVARYVDIPLQHIHANMLERMRRETTPEHIKDLLRRIRAGVPGIALRTTFIVGFPGETARCFATLLDFIREARFERLGVFTYSREEGTRAANMAGQVPEAVKRRRRDLAMSVQHAVAAQVAESFVGRTLKVLVESEASAQALDAARFCSWEHGMLRRPDARGGKDSAPSRAARDGTPSGRKGRFWVARGEADAPDIDGRVYVRGRLPLGEFARVKVVGHTDYDLIAEPAREGPR